MKKVELKKTSKKPVSNKPIEKVKVVSQRKIGEITLLLTDKQAIDAGIEETELKFVMREHTTSGIHVEISELNIQDDCSGEKMVITTGLLQALIDMAKNNRNN